MDEKNAINLQRQNGAYRRTSALTTADLLNDLIATNLGIRNVYETAAERLENESYAELLHDSAEQHKAFARELSNLVARYSGKPATDASRGSLAKQAWVILKAALTDGDGPILKDVAQDAEYVVEAYGETLGANLPYDVRELVRRHMSEARLTHEKLSAMSAVLNN